MASDASIYGLIRPQQEVQLQSPQDIQLKRLQLRHMMQQGEIGDLGLQQTRQGIADERRIADLFAAGKPTEQQIMAINPKRGMEYGKALSDRQNTEATRKKAEAETLAKNIGILRDQLATVNDQAGHDAWREMNARLLGPDMAAKIQPQFDPKKKQEGLLTADKLLEQLKPIYSVQDFGGTKGVVQSNPQAEGGVTGIQPKTQTPDSRASTASAAAGRAQSERHFQAGQDAPQYMETDAGLVALPKRPQPGVPPAGRLVTGPDGQPLGKPLKPLPPAVNTAIIENAQSLYTLDKAINLLGGKDVDSAKGDKAATGWKGYVPQAILDRLDSEGVDTRAEIADIGSLKIHDRSGAAVTVSESPRLMPFIPNVKDDPAVAARKLTRLRDEAKRMQQGLAETYSKDQGYKPSPVLKNPPAVVPKDATPKRDVPQGPAPVQISGDDGYNALPKGAAYIGPDGVPRIK